MAALYGSDLKRISSWELSKHHSVPGIKKQEEGKKKVLGFQLCHLQKNELASKSIHWGNRSVSLPGKTKQKKTFTEKNNSADRHKDSISPFLRLNNSPCSARLISPAVSQPAKVNCLYPFPLIQCFMSLYGRRYFSSAPRWLLAHKRLAQTAGKH